MDGDLLNNEYTDSECCGQAPIVHPAGPVHPQTSNTCDFCRGIDLSLVATLENDHALRLSGPSLRHAFANMSCRLCSWIVDQFCKPEIRPLVQEYLQRADVDCMLHFLALVPTIVLQCQKPAFVRIFSCKLHLKKTSVNREALAVLGLQHKYVKLTVETTGLSAPSPESGPIRRLIGARFDPSILRTWLNCCRQLPTGHPPPSSPKDYEALSDLASLGRFMLIDVRSGHIMEAAASCRYIALSYVWGKQKGYTEFSIEAASTFSVDWQKAPGTITRAAWLVRSIGERYLWVDAICIRSEDKAAVISAMSAIYACASFTIIAADGEDSDSGLKRCVGMDTEPLDSPTEQPTELITSTTKVSLLPVDDLPTFHAAVSRTKWASRAWCYQEALLGQKAVWFTDSEAFFRCENAEYREGCAMVTSQDTGSKVSEYDEMDKDRLSKFDPCPSGTPSWDRYTSIVLEYSSRQLSYAGDRLNAFSGILQRFGMEGFVETAAFCGLLGTRLGMTLFWTSDPTTTDEFRVPLDSGSLKYLPSWSWVGWNTSASFQFREQMGVLLKGTLADAEGYNLVGTVTTPNKYWRAWPFDFKLEMCPPETPGRYTLHLHAPILRCTIAPYDSDDRPSVFVSLPGSETQYGVAFIEMSPALLAASGDAFVFELVVPGHFVEQPSIWEYGDCCPAFFVEKRGKFYERIGSALLSCNSYAASGLAKPGTPSLDQFIEHRYIRLR